jgi:cobalt-zinc-cadmium resistance protein CzcA
MLSRLTRHCALHRGAVLVWTLALALLGLRAFSNLTVEVYPDISAQQVLVISECPGRSPREIEQLVAIPIELAMANVPSALAIRSRSIFGLSVVEVIFEEGVDKYFARQRVEELLPAVEVPEGIKPRLGPLATNFGEIFRYELQSNGTHDLMDLRTLNQWVISPRLERVSGVTELINFGGYEKQLTLKLDPRRMERFGLTLRDVVEAVRSNNANAGGSVLNRGELSFRIRGRGLLQDEHDLETTVINTLDGNPVYVRDVAEVELDARLPVGIFGKDDRDESIEGIVLMSRDDNPTLTLESLKREIDELNRLALPNGVQIVPFYDRQNLMDSTTSIIWHGTLAGIALVLLVLVAFLGNPVLAMVVALTIPAAFLLALIPVQAGGYTVRLLSIGAINFGMLVWGSVIMADQIAHRLTISPLIAASPRVRLEQLGLTAAVAADQVDNPILWSMLIVIACHVPLLFLTSIEGLIFRPMIGVAILSFVGAVVYALFVLPALATFTLHAGFRNWENPLLTWLRPLYSALLRRLLAVRWLLAPVLTVLVAGAGFWLAPRLGVEFIPALDEGVLWIRASFPPGTALRETARFANRMRAIVREFPEVEYAASQAGRNDAGTDPDPPNSVAIMVGLKPWREWTTPSQAGLADRLGERLRAEFPTIRFRFSQPIIDSLTEDTNGTSADLALEFTGDDLTILRDLAHHAATLLEQVPGATDVHLAQDGPQTQFVIKPDRVRCAQYDVHIDDVTRLVSTALGGEPVGTLYEPGRRFDIVARFDRGVLTSPESIGTLPVYSRSGVPLPLDQVADLSFTETPTLIARENGRRRITVRCRIEGRDERSFGVEARQRVDAGLEVPAGYHVRWIGMFENLIRIREKFLWFIPVTIAVVYVVLVLAFRSHRESLAVLPAIPVSFAGGALGLVVHDMTLNVSSSSGFVLLCGMSVIGSVLLVQWIDQLRRQGVPRDEAIVRGAQERLRPILMASLAAILGLFPASIAHGVGSDLQRPLATVIVWGLAASTLWTLLVVPVLYRLAAASQQPPREAR